MKLRLTRRLVAVSVVSVVAVAVGATALAGHLADGVKSYTGCLVPNDGVIIKVKEGDAPESACTAGQTQVHLSGGDITKISVTGALTGGGENGEVTIGLKPEFSVPQGCAAGQVAEWSGSAWNCGVDSDTTYTAGTGLDLSSGNEFSIEPAYRVKNTPDCSGGQFATGFDSGGGIVCAAPSAGSIATFQERQANFLAGDGIPDDGQWHTYVTLPVPASTYFVTGKGSLRQLDDDVGFRPQDAISCRLGNLPSEYTGFSGADNLDIAYGFALAGVVATSGEALTLQCSAANDLDLVSVRNATLVALKVG